VEERKDEEKEKEEEEKVNELQRCIGS